MVVAKVISLTQEIVLQCRGERWRGMGNLQRLVRMGKFGNLWFCPLVQLLLDCSYRCLPSNAV